MGIAVFEGLWVEVQIAKWLNSSEQDQDSEKIEIALWQNLADQDPEKIEIWIKTCTLFFLFPDT